MSNEQTNLSDHLTEGELKKVWILCGSQLLRWYERDLIDSATELVMLVVTKITKPK